MITESRTPGVFDGVYTFSACTRSCIQQKIINKCDCIDEIQTTSAARRCDATNSSDRECRERVYSEFAESSFQCECEHRCNEIYYSMESSISEWPSKKYEPYLWASLTEKAPEIMSQLETTQLTKENLMSVKIYFTELNRSVLKESPKYTIFGMMSTIGGSLGLYVGMSFITIIEFAGFLVELGKRCGVKCGKGVYSLQRKSSNNAALLILSSV